MHVSYTTYRVIFIVRLYLVFTDLGLCGCVYGREEHLHSGLSVVHFLRLSSGFLGSHLVLGVVDNAGELLENTGGVDITRDVGHGPESVDEPVDGDNDTVHAGNLEADRVADHDDQHEGCRGDGRDTDRGERREEDDNDVLGGVESDALGSGHEDDDNGEIDGSTGVFVRMMLKGETEPKHSPVHVDETTERNDKLGNRVRDTSLGDNLHRDGQSTSRRSGTPSGDPGLRRLEPVGVWVASGDGEEEDGQDDKQVETASHGRSAFRCTMRKSGQARGGRLTPWYQ